MHKRVHICAGTKVGVKDIRQAVTVQHSCIKQYLDRILIDDEVFSAETCPRPRYSE